MRAIPAETKAKIIKLRTVDKLPLKAVAERFGIASTQVTQIVIRHQKAQKEIQK